MATRVLPGAARGWRLLRAEPDGDRVAAVLALGVGGLPVAWEEWGQAMRVELGQVVGGRQRRRFGLGCVWAVVVIRTRLMFGSREPGGLGLRVVVLGGIGGAAGLVAYGLAHYRGLRSSPHVWSSVAVFLAVLLVFAVVTIALSRGVSSQVASARRYGLAGGVAVAASWLLALSPTTALKGWVALPLVVALFGPACVAALAARSGRDAAVGTRAALWSGIVAGLGVFIVWVTTTYAGDGGPYDAGMIRDFHSSHAPDLVTYAVSDNLGSGLVLLLLVPTVALAAGSLTARFAAPR